MAKTELNYKEEYYKNNKLVYMEQYHIERDLLCKIVDEEFNYDTLMDLFCYGAIKNTENFTAFRVGDEFYILHRDSGMMINWYKHLGRTNTCSQEHRTAEDYREFFRKLKEDMEHDNDSAVYRL